MAAFVYKALDARGEFVSGELQAPSMTAAIQQLTELGYVPLSTAPQRSESGGGWTLLPKPAVSQREVTVLLQDLALLLRSGLPLDEGLLLLTENAGGAMMRLINQLRSAIGSGANFAEALGSHPATALPELIAMVRSAEASGKLESALEALAQERVKAERMSAQIRAALRYPAFLLVVSMAVLLFFLLFVVPQFAEVIGDHGTPNQLIATVIALSGALRDYGDIIGAGVAGLLGLTLLALRTPRMRKRLLDPLASLPLVRGIVVLRRTARLCRSLGMMLSSGVNLGDALRLMNDTGIGGDRLTVVADRVRRGGRLVDAAAETNLVPPLAARMLRVGEESGALASVALRCAEYYETKLTEQVEKLTGIVGPAAIIFISVVIGTLLVSIMSTLISINQVVM